GAEIGVERAVWVQADDAGVAVNREAPGALFARLAVERAANKDFPVRLHGDAVGAAERSVMQEHMSAVAEGGVEVALRIEPCHLDVFVGVELLAGEQYLAVGLRDADGIAGVLGRAGEVDAGEAVRPESGIE